MGMNIVPEFVHGSINTSSFRLRTMITEQGVWVKMKYCKVPLGCTGRETTKLLQYRYLLVHLVSHTSNIGCSYGGWLGN